MVCSCTFQSLVTFSAFTTVGFTMQSVHCNSQSFMSFLGNGTIRHGTGLKPLYNRLYAFYFLYRHPCFRVNKIHQTSDIARFFLVYHCGILFEFVIISFSGCHLQHMDGGRIVTMLLSLGTHFMASHGIYGHICSQSQGIKRQRMLSIRI